MPSLGRMCYLTTVVGSFHGRVLAARLGAEGVIVVLRGATDGPYPIQSAVDVLVPADQLALAREILLADAVDDVFESSDVPGVEGPDAAEASSVAAGERGSDPTERAVIPVSSGHPSDSFSLRPGATAGPFRQRGRLRTLPALLVVMLVTVMIVGACLAVVVH
ncbi:MAG: hypothetical protein ABSB54_04600 [Acidimicrobiales bacterium]